MIKKIYLSVLILLSVGVNICFAKDSKANNDMLYSNNRKVQYYFYKAINAKTLEKYGECFDYLQYCYGLDSTNAEVIFQIGDFYNVLDNKELAIKFYKKSTQYAPDNLYYSISYANLSFELKKYDIAIKQYELIIKKDPEKYENYITLSEAYRLNGDLFDAVKVLDKLQNNLGMDQKISIRKYQLYMAMKQSKKAYAEIQKLIDTYPSEVSFKVLLGDLYLQKNDRKKALMLYNKAKLMDSHDPYLISSMSNYYEQIGDKVSAEKELRTAILSPKLDVNKKLNIILQYINTLQQDKKDIKTINLLFDTLMIQHPQEPRLNLIYGNLLMVQNNKNAARFQYQIYAQSNPTNPVGWEQMLSTTFPDSINLSINICKKAISYLPKQPQFYFYLGLCQSIKEDYKNSLLTLKKGVIYVDQNNSKLLSDFYGQMGDLFYYVNKKDSAYQSYDIALKYNPTNNGVLNNYSYFLSKERKNLDKAEQMSSQTVKSEPSNPTYLDTYGWVLFQQKAYLMAKIYIEQAIKYSEDKKLDVNSEMLEHYGDVLYKTNEPEKALEYWIKAKQKGNTKSKTLEKKIQQKIYFEQ